MPLPVLITAPVTPLLPDRWLSPFKIDPTTRAAPAITSGAATTHGVPAIGPAATPASGSPAITLWLRDNRAVLDSATTGGERRLPCWVAGFHHEAHGGHEERETNVVLCVFCDLCGELKQDRNALCPAIGN